MAHGEAQEERAKGQVEEMTEEPFLKDLYLFMKRRDTPIERIPHLGFKQIDLFVMYKTVKDLGGYHQVTAQQLWKQIYNTLGGNPRSTSAATCTRRHYEKLLLPYECHVKGGELMNVLSHQSKQFHYNNLSKEDDCPRPIKRRPLLLPLSQNPHSFLSDSRVRIIPLPVHYPHFYHPSHPVLPPYVPISSSLMTPHGPQVPQPQVSYPHPSPQSSTERSKEPLEHLRYLAEQYKSSSGLAEPLNLSVKGTGPESSGHPASSFTPAPANKNPKFLNQPSPLYPSKGMAKDEGCDTQEKDAAPGRYRSVPPYPHPQRAPASHVIDLTSTPTPSSCSPIPASAPTLRTDSTSPMSLLCNRRSNSTMTHLRSSPKRDFTDWPGEEKEENPRLSPRTLGHSHVLPSSPGDNGGKMEIQIPLSVLHKWIRLCGTSTNRHGTFQPPIPTQEVDTRDRCSSNSPTKSNLTNMIFHNHVRDQDRSSAIEDLSPTPTTLTTSDHHSMLSYHPPSYKPSRSGGILKNVSGQTAYPLDEQDTSNSYYSKPTNGWDPYDRGCQAHPIQLKMHSSPLTLGQDIIGPKPPAYSQDTSRGKVERPGMGPSAVLMVNPASPSVVHLTSEELMKLKRIISSSS